MPLQTSQFNHILKLLARKLLGTSWAKYPFSRCRSKGETSGLAGRQASLHVNTKGPYVGVTRCAEQVGSGVPRSSQK